MSFVRGTIAIGVSGAIVLASATAGAAPMRVGIFSRPDLTVAKRLERNVAAMHVEGVSTQVTSCTRDAVSGLLDALQLDAALCADGDAIGVWKRDGDRVVLKQMIVTRSNDESTEELDAARATMALKGGSASETITVAPSSSESSVIAPITTPTTPGQDTTPSKPTPAKKNDVPRLVAGLGPGVMASNHGASIGVSGELEIGVSRWVALVPWVSYIPSNRLAERDEGSAKFRPTLFGMGFTIPFLPPTSFVVPRLGCGYAILWMHVAPESAAPPATERESEDLLAPVMYATGAASFAITPNLRVTGEGLFGTASHQMVVRIAGNSAAKWGVPLAGLALRAEWVIK